MDDDEGEYEELDDDFLMLANEGQPALILDETPENEEDFHNKGVLIVKDEMEERL